MILEERRVGLFSSLIRCFRSTISIVFPININSVSDLQSPIVGVKKKKKKERERIKLVELVETILT